MESNQTVNLYITYVDKEGPFLKIWGQVEKNNAIYVEQFLAGISQHFDAGVGKVAPETLQPGTLVCAKYKDNKYYRASIINVCIQDTFVEVSFVDFGNKDIVTCGNIRSLQNLPSAFISVPPLAVSFIFAEAHCVGGGIWDDGTFNIISKDLKYRDVQCQLLIQATQYFLVKIYLNGTDLCSNLIHRTLMQPITLPAQQAVLLSMSLQKQMVQQQVSPIQTTSATINTYKACTLEPGCQYQVYVSYVNDGPCQFSVQLKQTEDALAKLMSDINTLPLKLLEDLPIPGTICLAKCQEDDSVCRAVVTNEVDNQFKVFYVDFGNYEVVPIDALYQIPFKYVIPKVMAIRYALDGVDKSTLTIEMQLAFKKFVDNRLLHMKVLPTPTRMAIPKCELWDPETKTSALDVVNCAAVQAYPEPIALARGFSQTVKVSFVYSCSRFYVQLSSKETELSNLMTELQLLCHTMYDTLNPSVIKVGLPCCALFEGDQLWYRSQIVAVLGDRVQVRYIDYGNEEEMQSSLLKSIDGEQLTVLRPQAIECCLNGYQNMEDDSERNALLENIILEGTFTMKVVDMVDKKALVDLYDASNYNVASLLLDKIAAINSQVSPILVQAGNKIEHRKSPKEWQNTSREQGFRGDGERNSGREGYSRNERSSDRSDKPWRQNNRENRNFDNSHENNERDSWRQNNKGFSPSHQRPSSREKDPKRDNWNNTAGNNNSEWGDTQSPQTTPKEEWNNTNSNTVVNKEWSTPPTNDAGYRNDRQTNDYEKRRGGFDRDNRGDRYSGNRRDEGFRKTPDFRGGVLDSGSEQGYHKGPRTSSRNDRGLDRHQFDARPVQKSPLDEKDAAVAEDSWNVSAVTAPIDAAPATAAFLPHDVIGTEAKVAVSWFHHPGLFYCQLVDFREQLRSMVEEIQQFYKNRRPEPSAAGAPVIGLFPEDGVLYRAQVLEAAGGQYKVFYVDFGNVSTVSKVWPIERRFMAMPAQAIACGLRGVTGAHGDWGDPDLYGVYFDKESFSCKFVDRDEDRILVDISHESEDVAQQLVRDGLAVSTQPAVKAIEIPLLHGQQLKATLMSINNLADIIIVLECGLAVSCAVHNLETATETFEDTLKGLLQQAVIVYVDNVIDDKLEVTFYDTEGNKHAIVEPDEGAYDVVERLCPMPVLSPTLDGYVSFAKAACVSVQPAERSDQLARLLDQLFEAYEGSATGPTIVPEEGQVYAVRSDDGNWYRGRVTAFDDEKATVCYVDYGNSESVAFTAIRELDAQFFDVCALSLQIIVPDAESFLDKDVTATVTFGQNGWEGTLVVSEATLVEADKIEDGSGDTGFATSSLEKPVSECAPTESEGSNTRAEGIREVEVETEVEDETEVEGEAEVASEGLHSFPVIGQSVYASHVDSPNEFYLQFTESLGSIEELQAELQERIEEMPVLECPAIGMFCAAPYSVDQQWYRAEILDADDDITTVRFVDFGNTDVIDNATTQIRTLSSKLLSLALYATRCSLKVEPRDDEWSAAALESFEQQALVENLSAEFLDQNEKTCYVELYSDGANVREALLLHNLALPMAESSEMPKPVTGFVSHANSPSEFWMQLETCVDELEWIAEQLSAAETFPQLEDVTPGTLCAALFPDDQMWYRARILSNTVAGVELLFIDYGNSSTSASLRQLPEDLVATPPLAQKCCLRRPDGVAVWTPEASAKFGEIAMEGQTIFVVKKIATDETSTVQLSLNGRDVADMLQPETEDGYVKEAGNLQSLRVEKASGEGVDGELTLEPMPGQDLNEEAAKKFEEMNEQGSTLFQIEFVNESTIRLYLNGRDIRPLLGGMQNASFDISQTENDTSIPDTGNSQDADEDINSSLPNVHEIVQDLQTEVFNMIKQKEVDSDYIIPTSSDSEPHPDEKTSLIIGESERGVDSDYTIPTSTDSDPHAGEKISPIIEESEYLKDNDDPKILVEPSEDTVHTSLPSSEDVITNSVVQSSDNDLGQKLEAWQLSEEAEDVMIDHEEQDLDVPECHTSPNPEDVTSSADVESSNIEHEQKQLEDIIKLEECHTNQISENVMLTPNPESSKNEPESENLEDTEHSNADGDQKILVLSEEKSQETSDTGTEDMKNEVETEPKSEERAEDDEKIGQTEILEDNAAVDERDEIQESPELEKTDRQSNASTRSPDKSSLSVTDSHKVMSEEKSRETSDTGTEDMTDIKDSSNEVKTEPKSKERAEDEKIGQTEILGDNAAVDERDGIQESPELEKTDCQSNASTRSPDKSSLSVTDSHKVLSEEKFQETSDTGTEDMTDIKDSSNEVKTEPKSKERAEDDEKNGQTEILEDNAAVDERGEIQESPELEKTDCQSNASTRSPDKSSLSVTDSHKVLSEENSQETSDTGTEDMTDIKDSSNEVKTEPKSKERAEDDEKIGQTEILEDNAAVDERDEIQESPELEKTDRQSNASTRSPGKSSLSVTDSHKKKVPVSTQKSPNSSPKKAIEKSSSTKGSPKKGSPVKVSPNSPVKVSPKKDSAKVSPNKGSPIKVSTKRQSPLKEADKSSKTSPVKELSPQKKQSPKNKTPSDSVKKSSPKEPSTEPTAEVKEMPLGENSEPANETSECSGTTSENGKMVPASVSRSETPSGDNLEVEAIMKTIDNGSKKEIGSRPHSSCSGKMNFDDKIVPACLSRPETPDEENVEIEAIPKTTLELIEVGSSPQSSCSGKMNFDDKIVPACLSRPETPDEENVEIEAIPKTTLEQIEVGSSPQSSCSRKMSLDERTVPSCISRPESTVEGDTEVAISSMTENIEKNKNEVEHRPDSASSGKIKYDDKIVSAVLTRPHTFVDDENADVGVSE